MVRYLPQQVFVPSGWVQLDDLFVGRADELLRAQSALKSPGRNVVIYGARGLGKTTFGRHLELQSTEENVVWIDCDPTWSVRNFIGRLLNKLGIEHEVRTRSVSDGYGGGISAKIPVLKGHALHEIKNTTVTRSYQDAIYSVDYIADRLGDLSAPTIVILDEFDSLFHSADYRHICGFLVQLIKAIAGRSHELIFRFVIIGVGNSVQSLIGEHGSVERNIIEVPMGKIPDDYIDNFIRVAESLTSFHFETGVRHHFVEQADGYPFFVHSIGLEACRLAALKSSEIIDFETYENAFENCFNEHTRLYKARVQEKQRGLSEPEQAVLFGFAADRSSQTSAAVVARNLGPDKSISATDTEKIAAAMAKDQIFLYFDRKTKKFGFIDPIMKVFLRERKYFRELRTVDPTRRQLDLFAHETRKPESLS
jgi:hypothetical protein